MARIFITGTAGFIGFHLAELLLQDGHDVAGFDAVTDYYDVRLKRSRLDLLRQHARFTPTEARLEDNERLVAAFNNAAPEVIVHLAAQAGVRYSLENPRAYMETNVMGTFNVMECARTAGVRHLLMASTSSAYGANKKMPFAELDRAEHPLTIYAASKRANEMMGHSYAHLWGIPTTLFRFFTVYGPWGRPDMAPILFAERAFARRPIDVFNHGQMKRDFTYVTDLVRAIRLLIDVPPEPVDQRGPGIEGDSLSPVAPYRMVNIGNGAPVPLLTFIDEIERAVGKPIQRNFMDMQKGDVPATWADTTLLRALTGYSPETDIREGVTQFIDWYRDYHDLGH